VPITRRGADVTLSATPRKLDLESLITATAPWEGRDQPRNKRAPRRGAYYALKLVAGAVAWSRPSKAVAGDGQESEVTLEIKSTAERGRTKVRSSHGLARRRARCACPRSGPGNDEAADELLRRRSQARTLGRCRSSASARGGESGDGGSRDASRRRAPPSSMSTNAIRQFSQYASGCAQREALALSRAGATGRGRYSAIPAKAGLLREAKSLSSSDTLIELFLGSMVRLHHATPRAGGRASPAPTALELHMNEAIKKYGAYGGPSRASRRRRQGHGRPRPGRARP